MKKITIQKCKLDDAYYILKIYNETVSNGLSGTKTKIQLNDHIKWLKKKLLSKKDIIYIYKINKIIIGYIRFEKIHRSGCEISIYFRSKESDICIRGFKRLYLSSSTNM